MKLVLDEGEPVFISADIVQQFSLKPGISVPVPALAEIPAPTMPMAAAIAAASPYFLHLFIIKSLLLSDVHHSVSAVRFCPADECRIACSYFRIIFWRRIMKEM